MAIGRKLSNTDGFLMIAVAIFIDIAQAGISLLNVVPGLGTVINKFVSIFAILTFFTWLAIKMVGWKSQMVLFGGGAFELIPIPFLSALPFFTGVIIAIIIRDRAKKYLSKIKPKIVSK